jgi:hypothetical protein
VYGQCSKNSKAWRKALLDESVGDTPVSGRRSFTRRIKIRLEYQAIAALYGNQVHNKSHLPTDEKMAKRNAGTVAAGNRIHGFGIAKNQQDKVTGRFDYRDAVGRTHVYQKNDPLEQGVAEGYQLDEGAVETITALVKKIPGIGKYYQMAQQYKPQLIEILKTSKSGKEVKQKMEQLAASQSATVSESGMLKQLGGLAVGGGSILSAMWDECYGTD